MILLIPFIPIAGQVAGMLASYFISRGDIKRQNRYNSPRQQAKRLQEAGIPLAASKYFESNQSTIPDTSGFQGAGQALGTYYEKQIEHKQLGKMNSEIAKLDAETAKTWADALIADTKGRLDVEISKWLRDTENLDKIPENNLQRNLLQDQQLKLAEISGKTIANSLSAIQNELMTSLHEKGYLEDKWIAEMDTILKNLEISEILFDSEKMMFEFRQKFVEGIERRKNKIGQDPDSFRSFIQDLATMIIMGAGSMKGFK